ncbi:MAG: YggS family pyridoxal phosphate-dependent enzyme [Winogradskyella sp.]|nr:YggS family pyridoxal phosphate-dependent enzyme [Winogradskyella sp.]MBT8375451.1 YggS family pyridoxal phosphate-dependent enzyme [Bacteroidia bacterium]NNC46722.1 YggS family pyridoxal phosphate-dependent enzyme [Winogradskyella sp.]NNF86217.1 YggS family pyridoxal phosphate-dependent enzyme [Winogradskyella sp.]NNK40311.1 YggS family pyridoxal phosphate-dependent enzyme [Winogradskyella sp.]
MSITTNLKHILNTIPDHVTLVAVSKTKPIEDLLEAYNAGQRHFGENKIQEMTSKAEQLPKDIKWHMIGHVQTNKVKYMAPFVSLVHGVDSYKLLKEINKQAKKHQRVIDCLIQIKIAKEDSKFGMSFEDTKTLVKSDKFSELKHIKIKGLMGMATFTDDSDVLNTEFSYLQNCFNDLKEELADLDTLSMGMSGDYEIAINHGSNMIRVGSNIFGARQYN